MALGGTAAYDGLSHLPGLVSAARKQANALGFEHSCRPEQGRLLKVLAAGRRGGVIGETGTGCGVGLGWMASEADAQTKLVSVETDESRATAATSVFGGHENITVHHADWTALLEYGPFDLLVLDGGNAGKHDGATIDTVGALTFGGTARACSGSNILRCVQPRSGSPPISPQSPRPGSGRRR